MMLLDHDQIMIKLYETFLESGKVFGIFFFVLFQLLRYLACFNSNMGLWVLILE